MTTNFISKGIDMIQKAVSVDETNDAEKYEEAFSLYCQGIQYLIVGLKYEKNTQIINSVKSKISKYIKRAEELKVVLSQPKKPKKEPKKIAKEHLNGDEDDDVIKLRAGLGSSILMEKPDVAWSDVAGLLKAKALLKEAVVLPIKFPQLFIGNRKPWKGILLYGPPGTGKSYLAKAVATEANNSTFFSVSASDLISKYVGESEKLIKYLFTIAKEKKPSIIFIDEIDSLATKRSDNEQDSTRRVKTELLLQMQSAEDGVLILGATNCPWDLDSGVRRRFAKRIYIALPNPSARAEIFRIHIGSGPDIDVSEMDLHVLAQRTSGFSGSDVAGVCQDALMEPLRTLLISTHFKKVCYVKDEDGMDDNGGDYMWVPCSSGDPNGIKRNFMEFGSEEQDKIKCEPLKLSHFLRVLQNVKPSVGRNDILRNFQWTEQYGQKG
eukprot:126915_1